MQLTRLEVTNFRGFESFTLDFDPSFTLLVGDNGTGKTGALEATSVALGSVFLGLWGTPPRTIDHDEVRRVVYVHNGMPDLQPQYPAIVSAVGVLDGAEAKWTRILVRPKGRTIRKAAKAVESYGARLAQSITKGEPAELPLLAYYGTQRLWKQIKDTAGKRDVGNRFNGYVDCLDPASNHRQLLEWMHQQALVTAQRGIALPHIEAIERAVCDCVDGARRFSYDVLHGELRIEWHDGRITPFDLLSDGYRNAVAITADLAWRAAVLNPHHGADAARRATGVVLIDELDLHLHPRWQRRIAPDMRRAFPGVQFIATTHSPQVVSSVEAASVRILQRDQPVLTLEHAKGRDTNSLLEDVFGVNGRPEAAAERLSELFDLIDRDHVAEAERLLHELRADLGPHDPDVVRARTMLDLLSPEGHA